MEITLDGLCEGVSEALKKEGHEGVLYLIGDNEAQIVSDRTKLRVVQKEEESKTSFEIMYEQGKISSGVYDYIDGLKCNKNFPSGAKEIVLEVGRNPVNRKQMP